MYKQWLLKDFLTFLWSDEIDEGGLKKEHNCSFCVAQGVILSASIARRGEQPFMWKAMDVNACSLKHSPRSASRYVNVETLNLTTPLSSDSIAEELVCL